MSQPAGPAAPWAPLPPPDAPVYATEERRRHTVLEIWETELRYVQGLSIVVSAYLAPLREAAAAAALTGASSTATSAGAGIGNGPLATVGRTPALPTATIDALFGNLEDILTLAKEVRHKRGLCASSAVVAVGGYLYPACLGPHLPMRRGDCLCIETAAFAWIGALTHVVGVAGQLLRELTLRLQSPAWETNQRRLGDIFARIAPFFKLYSAYVANCACVLSLPPTCGEMCAVA
jgi:hypothetical protein